LQETNDEIKNKDVNKEIIEKTAEMKEVSKTNKFDQVREELNVNVVD